MIVGLVTAKFFWIRKPGAARLGHVTKEWAC